MSLGKVIAGRMQRQSELVEKARAEFNFRSIQSWLPQKSRVLDVGAWACYLGQLLRDRRNCEVLSLDVIDANKTSMPFRKFDGKTLPSIPEVTMSSCCCMSFITRRTMSRFSARPAAFSGIRAVFWLPKTA